MSRILLGVTGGIAAYKAGLLCRGLRAAGHEVHVVLTRNATRFITATSFQALSGAPVHASLWDAGAQLGMAHIELARWAEQVLVAPATADTIARLAHGRADDLLATVCLATEAPLALAPAMNQVMWRHPATRANVATLRARGVRILGPASGALAEGESGPGRMLEPEAIIAALAAADPAPVLAGRRVVVSAGPTLEDLDPVRFLGNRSSGRMGFAVAAAAAAAEAQVTLVAGPVHLATPPGVARRVDVRSAREMLDAMLDAAAGADVVIAVAAVADYRPRAAAAQKIKKRAGTDTLQLELVENPDILAALGALEPRPFLVGFAAETEQLAEHARDKLQRKKLDLIAANLVGAERGFERDENALTVFWAGGEAALPEQPKATLAAALVELVARRLGAA